LKPRKTAPAPERFSTGAGDNEQIRMDGSGSDAADTATVATAAIDATVVVFTIEGAAHFPGGLAVGQQESVNNRGGTLELDGQIGLGDFRLAAHQSQMLLGTHEQLLLVRFLEDEADQLIRQGHLEINL